MRGVRLGGSNDSNPESIQKAKEILERQAALDEERRALPEYYQLLLLEEKIASGQQLNCFIMSALTNVPEKKFHDYIDMLHAITLQLAVVYKVHAYSPLLDSESSLKHEDDKDKPKMCYERDLEFVRKSDFLIFESSYGSTGGGQEMHHADIHGKPAIIISQMKNSSEHGISNHPSVYITENRNGNGTEFCKNSVFRGRGGVSLMLQGNPAVKAILAYRPDDWTTLAVQNLSESIWKLHYWSKEKYLPIYPAIKQSGKWWRKKTEHLNPRSSLLSNLAGVLEGGFGLQPRTAELNASLSGLLSNPQENQSQIKELEEKIKLVKHMRNHYHPSQRNAIFGYLNRHFPEIMLPRGEVVRVISPSSLTKRQLLSTR